MRSMLAFLVALFLLFSCSKQSRQLPLFSKIKQLEISRSSSLKNWQQVYASATSTEQKILVLDAISKTRNQALFPLLKKAFNQSDEDTLKIVAGFGFSQLNSDSALIALINALSRSDLSSHVQSWVIRFLANHPYSVAAKALVKAYEDHPELRSHILISLGIFARKKIQSPTIVSALLDSSQARFNFAQAYFLSNSRLDAFQTNRLIERLKTSPENAQILLLKKLTKQSFQADSTSGPILKDFLLKSFKNKKSSWRKLYYATQLVPLTADSVLISELLNLTDHPNIHVRLKALNTLSELAPERALPLLTQKFAKLPDGFEKGAVCQLIAKLDPTTGYMLINQNLDKGNAYFKAQLLTALRLTKLRLAKKVLRQFLFVDDPVLAQAAFENLKKARALRTRDVKQLLNSDDFTRVALAVEWFSKRRNKPSFETLLTLYRKFNKPSQFELQWDLGQLILEQPNQPSAIVDSLIKSAAHPVIAARLARKYQKNEISPFDFNLLPNFLQADSLATLPESPVVEVETSKGSFQIKLEPDIAPLTVKNFLHLVETGFYEQIYFHRVVPDFVVQAGDPTGTGWGGVDYLLPSEHSPRPFVRGAVGNATAGFDTGSSQFFICQSAQPHLDGNYTRFGIVIKGMSVVDQLTVGDRIVSVKRIQ